MNLNWKEIWKMIWEGFKKANEHLDTVPKPDPVIPSVVPDIPQPDPGHEEKMVLFDLPRTAIDMFQAGFPGREGELLYVLGQVANGWAIGKPPEGSPSLDLLETYYKEIERWYMDKIGDAKNVLLKNPKASLTILDNDIKNRFGFRIGPPTNYYFKDFEDRVQMGYFVPESEY